MYVTALRAAAAAFKREEQMRQLHSGSFRVSKNNGEQVDMVRIPRADKVLAAQGSVHPRFNFYYHSPLLRSISCESN